MRFWRSTVLRGRADARHRARGLAPDYALFGAALDVDAAGLGDARARRRSPPAWSPTAARASPPSRGRAPRSWSGSSASTGSASTGRNGIWYAIRLQGADRPLAPRRASGGPRSRRPTFVAVDAREHRRRRPLARSWCAATSRPSARRRALRSAGWSGMRCATSPDRSRGSNRLRDDQGRELSTSLGRRGPAGRHAWRRCASCPSSTTSCSTGSASCRRSTASVVVRKNADVAADVHRRRPRRRDLAVREAARRDEPFAPLPRDGPARARRTRPRAWPPGSLASGACCSAPLFLRRDQEGARERDAIGMRLRPALRAEPAHLALPRARSGRPRARSASAATSSGSAASSRPRALPDQPREPEGRLLREERRNARARRSTPPARSTRTRSSSTSARISAQASRPASSGSCPRWPSGARALQRDDLALHGELGRHRRHDRPLARGAGGALRRARRSPAARRLPRLVPPVRLRLRRHGSGRARRVRERARPRDRARPAALSARERLEDAARLEPRPARQHRRRPDRREARRLSRPPEAAGPAGAARGSRRRATGPTRSRCGS